MDKVVAELAWLAAAVTISLVAFLTFRGPLSALINRTQRLTKSGLETYETQPTQSSDEKKGIDEFLKSFDNPLLAEAEELIVQDMAAREIQAPVDREKALVRSLAATHIILRFENAYRVIWASQFALLHFLNSREQGADESDLTHFYERGKTDMPVWYADYAFTQWVGFLLSYNLIIQDEARYYITVAGQEFLQYIISTRKPAPQLG